MREACDTEIVFALISEPVRVEGNKQKTCASCPDQTPPVPTVPCVLYSKVRKRDRELALGTHVIMPIVTLWGPTSLLEEGVCLALA